MSAEYFLDSNAILYSYMDTDKNKKERAQEILVLADCCISSQVMGKYVATSSGKPGYRKQK